MFKQRSLRWIQMPRCFIPKRIHPTPCLTTDRTRTVSQRNRTMAIREDTVSGCLMLLDSNHLCTSLAFWVILHSTTSGHYLLFFVNCQVTFLYMHVLMTTSVHFFSGHLYVSIRVFLYFWRAPECSILGERVFKSIQWMVEKYPKPLCQYCSSYISILQI